ncbi:hypothetical protein ACWGE0_23820 [Lentzea sp. NPDC054927]
MGDEGQQFLDWAYDLGFEQAGVHPAWRHVHRETKIMPLSDGSFRTEAEQRAWQDAADAYHRLHPEAGPPHHPREFAKWRAHQAMAPLEMAAADPEFGLIVIGWLREPGDNHRDRGLVGFLHETEDGRDLLRQIRQDDADPAAHLAALTAVTTARLRPT